jgi:hypothetical protein
MGGAVFVAAGGTLIVAGQGGTASPDSVTSGTPSDALKLGTKGRVLGRLAIMWAAAPALRSMGQVTTPTGISPRIFLRSELCDNRHAEQARDY